jgi:8-oxo-dGTP diphosphatase
MKRPLVSVVAIIPINGKIVMIRRATTPFVGKWSLPGGHLELGEKLKDAIIREVKEETNLKIRVKRLVGFRNFIGRDKGKLFHYIIFCFDCATISNDLRAGKGVLEVRLINPKNLHPEVISPSVKGFLKHKNYIKK